MTSPAPRQFLGTLRQDVVFTVRLFRRETGPIALTIAGLALAIGVSTAVFTLTRATTLRGEGIRNPDSVFRISTSPTLPATPWAYDDFTRVRQAQSGFRVVGTAVGGGATLRERAEPDEDHLERISHQPVSGDYFDVLGAHPAVGRLLTVDDDARGAAPVVVLQYAFWTRRFQQDRNLVGRTLWLNDRPYTVVGVAERGFGLAPAWISLGNHYQALRETEASAQATRVARIGALQRIVQPTASDTEELKTLLARAAIARSPGDNVFLIVRADPGTSAARIQSALTPLLQPMRTTDGPPPVPILLTAANAKTSIELWQIAQLTILIALLIFLGCANVANLLLASVLSRSREIGTRLALGASAGRVARQLLTESLVLGLTGGALGLCLAAWLVPILATLAYQRLPETADLSLDWTVYLFVALVTIVCSAAAGLAPARLGRRGDLLSALKSDRAAMPVRLGPLRLRSVLIGGQAAASLMLLVLASLSTRAAIEAASVDLGADIDKLVNVQVTIPGVYGKSRSGEYMDAARERILQISGVASVSRAQFPPFISGGATDGARLPDGRSFSFRRNASDARYFSTIGARVISGRTYTDDEVKTLAPVAVISQGLARAFWPNEDPIGSSLERVWGRDDPVGATPWNWTKKPAGTRVIGVVVDTAPHLSGDFNVPTLYLPLASPIAGYERFVVRVIDSIDPRTLVRPLQEAVRAIDANVRREVTLLSDTRTAELEQPKNRALLAVLVAAVSLALAGLGLFGVTAFAAAQRRHEMSVRVTLGARRAQLVGLLLRDSLTPVLAGLAIGVVFALLGVKTMRTLPLLGVDGYSMFGVSARDPFAIVAAIVVLVGAATLAALIPARRASRIDPVSALKDA